MMTKERWYAHLFIQAATTALLLLYVAMTREAYPGNGLCLAVALALGAIGFSRPFAEAALAALLAVVGYGAYAAYMAFGADAPGQLGWNDVVWLLVLPLFAMLGALRLPRSEQAELAARQLAYEKKRLSKELAASQESMPLDASLGFADRDDFEKQLQSAAERALEREEGQEYALLAIETQHYWDYKTYFGYEQTLTLLQATAELIRETIPEAEVKGYLGGGAFAVFFPTTDTTPLSSVELRLNVKYNAMVLSRPRREGLGRTRLRYGAALFPTQTTDAAVLLSRAKQELEMNLRDL